MTNTMLTTTEAATMTVTQLRTFALTATRQLSLFCTRYAAAKDAAAIGDTVAAQQFLAAAKTAYKRACEDDHGQQLRAAATAAVVAANGNAQDATVVGGKDVVRLAMGRKGAVWLESWGTR